MYAAGELGVRLDVPYRSLTEHERDIVLHGEPVRRQVTLRSGRNGRSVQLSVNYDNAVAAVERSLRSDNERTRRLVQRPDGGRILAAGKPEEVAYTPGSATGPWLAEHLGLPEAHQPDVLPGRRASASLRAVGGNTAPLTGAAASRDSAERPGSEGKAPVPHHRR